MNDFSRRPKLHKQKPDSDNLNNETNSSTSQFSTSSSHINNNVLSQNSCDTSMFVLRPDFGSNQKHHSTYKETQHRQFEFTPNSALERQQFQEIKSASKHSSANKPEADILMSGIFHLENKSIDLQLSSDYLKWRYISGTEYFFEANYTHKKKLLIFGTIFFRGQNKKSAQHTNIFEKNIFRRTKAQPVFEET